MPSLTRRLLLAGLASAPVLACGNSRQASSAESVATADQNLRGRWVLIQFQPEQALEPALDGLLRAQLGVLVLSFDGSTLRAQGVGLAVERAYQVIEAVANQFRLVVRDPDGVTYDVAGAFNGNELDFQSQTSPWRGRGRLRHL